MHQTDFLLQRESIVFK